MNRLGRRQFIKMGAAACAAAGMGGIWEKALRSPAHAQVPLAPVPRDFFYSACHNNCGSACVLKCYTENGQVVRMESDGTLDDNWDKGLFQIRACPRGRSFRRYMYAPERLQYPLKRVGKRGEGRFERISWDEALDTIAAKLKHCKENYGNASIYSHYASGLQCGALMRRESLFRFLNLIGGYTASTSDYSSGQNQVGLEAMYGIAGYSGNAITDIAHTKLAVFFGLNTTETRMSGGGLQYELLQAKKKSGARIIVIDPRFSETCVTVADEWIAIRPGTDAALASALAYVLLTENMADTAFIRRYVLGFDAASMPADAPGNASYSDYILGTGYDKIAKTPEWAASITGIPAVRIRQLAREMGQAKPCYITQGWGLQRQAAGEMTTMAVAALAVLTGNVGVRGGNNGDRDAYFPLSVPRLPVGKNPVTTTFPVFLWLKAIENGKALTAAEHGVTGAERLPADVKFVWSYGGNAIINQHSDINYTRKVLSDESKCEMIVVMDTHLTASAQWADIVLPSCAYVEAKEIYGPSYGQNIDYYIFSGASTPYHESRDIYDVCTELARRFGVEEAFTEGRDREAWLEHNYATICRKNMPSLPPTLAEARKQGIWRQEKSRDLPITLEAFRKNPESAPLLTPSGKIELYSQKLVALAAVRKAGDALGEVIPPTPQYVVTWEGFEDKEQRARFPLQLIGHHYKGRTHSHYAACDWLQEVMPQALWINPLDAAARGLAHGDMAAVFNDRGQVRVPVKVTPRIMPGVISLPQGAWYKADKKGVDHGGCINTLTRYRPTIIAQANPQHTNLVEVRKA